MAERKEVVMILKVDLQCYKCYKKVKKVLCKFPQIRDQVYDEKANKVIIKVFCCNPEKLRDKLCCKGCGSIKSIEIVEPPPPKPKPKTPPPEKPKTPPPEKPKTPPPEKPKTPPPVDPAPPPPPQKPKTPPPKPPPPADPAPPPPQRPPPADPTPPPPVMPAVPVWPQPPCGQPIGVCCSDCYHGHTGGPCYEMGYRPVYDSWGGGGGYTRCDYFNEENSQGCSIM